MSVLGIIAVASRVAGETVTTDAQGHVTTNSWILPENAEIIYGGISSLLIFFMLWKFGGPAIKKSMAARTARIQKQLDDAAADKAAASLEAADIRTAKGDIAAERARIMADAKVQADAVLADGRARLSTEVAELETKAAAEVAAVGGRVGDELRAEIGRLSAAAVDQVVNGSLDTATHQALIEDFIANVGGSK